MSVSAMIEMATVIRETLQRYGSRLHDLTDDDLHDLAMIVSAFGADLYREVERRERAR